MIKFIAKCIIVLLAFQSAMDYLRRQEIIEGSIKINFAVIQQKLFAAIPAKKIATGMLQFAEAKIEDGVILEVQVKESASLIKSSIEGESVFKIVYHRVREGESLRELAQQYAIHWRVIQRMNQLLDGQPIYVGQVLKIPMRKRNLDWSSI